MSRTVLVLGANGFIGAQVAASLARSGWTVRAGARRPEAARARAPAHDWVQADFAKLTQASAWTPLLSGVDAVVNCVGVLQDGGGDSTRLAHIEGPRALISACEQSGGKTLIHISAVGADAEAPGDYGQSKAETERLLSESGADWLILRPSLVIGRAVFGGTGLIRALAAFPLVIPVLGGSQTFRPIAMEDVCAAVLAALEPEAPRRRSLDLAGPEPLSLADILKLYRGWLGIAPGPVVRVPRALAWPVLKLGDLAGRLGWPSPLRTTAAAQMDYDVEGDPADAAVLGVRPQSLSAWLTAHPATVQDVWHARLWAVRPVAIITLSLFWLATGLISLGPGWAGAVAILREGGYGPLAPAINAGGAVMDIVLGLALLVRPWTARVALLMILATLGYLIAGTLSLPHYWLDPLGPWLKVLPMMALCLFVAATDARR